MTSNNDGSGKNTCYALSLSEKKSLAEACRFTKECENKIAEDKANFAGKSFFGLWWDAKGLFNCSDVEDVTAYMEEYEEFFEEIHNFSAQVEKGDPKSYDKLLTIKKKLDKMEMAAKRDVENNQSSAICRMLREFLDKKYNLVHNLKKVECIVLKQKTSDAEQARERSEMNYSQMSKKMDGLIEENRSVRREGEEKVSKLLEENRGIKEIIEILRKEKEELATESEKRSEAIRLESEERLKQVLKEAEERSEARLRKMEEESDKMRLEAEERSEARLRKMKEESDKMRLEAEIIRRESDEKLKQAVEEANRRSEARMQEMAEQNRANLQNITKMLEAMNVP